MVRLDLTADLRAQGPFDLIIHKVTDLMTSSNPEDKAQLRRFEEFLVGSPGIAVIDPVARTADLTNRVTTLKSLEIAASATSELFFVPKTIVVGPGEKPGLTDFWFPVVTKHPVACGLPNSHHIGVYTSLQQAESLIGPLVVQEYIRHGGAMLKVYAIGDEVFVDARSSIPLTEGRRPAFSSLSPAAETNKYPPSEQGCWSRPPFSIPRHSQKTSH